MGAATMNRGMDQSVKQDVKQRSKTVRTREARLKDIYDRYRRDPSLEHLRYRSRFIPGHGNHTPRILFVTEAPSAVEDKSGQLLVGPITRCLSELLMSVDLKPQHCYATSVVKYRPPAGRDPRPDEVLVSKPYLLQEVSILKPTVVVPLGRTATSVFLPGEHMNDVRGTIRPMKNGPLVVPVMNPLSYLYYPTLKPIIFDDFQVVGGVV